MKLLIFPDNLVKFILMLFDILQLLLWINFRRWNLIFPISWKIGTPWSFVLKCKNGSKKVFHASERTLFLQQKHFILFFVLNNSYYVLKLFFIKNLCDSLLYYKTNAEHPIFVISVCQLLWIRMDHHSKALVDQVS